VFTAVKEAAKKLVESKGPEAWRQVAKVHFKTAHEIARRLRSAAAGKPGPLLSTSFLAASFTAGETPRSSRTPSFFPSRSSQLINASRARNRRRRHRHVRFRFRALDDVDLAAMTQKRPLNHARIRKLVRERPRAIRVS